MTSSALSSPGAPRGLSYARARLLLGIAGVGSSVLAATALLAFDLPARLLSTSAEQPLPQALSSLLPLLLLGVLALLPFDLLGGVGLVRHRPSLREFFGRWSRGIVMQLAVGLTCITALMLAARAAGDVGALMAFLLLQLALAAVRGPMALAIASFQKKELPPRLLTAAQTAGLAPDRIVMLETPDEGFVGGWTGISARKLFLPARWMELPDPALAAALLRRRIIAESGAHRRGVLGAIAWNTVGATLVITLASANVGTAAGVLTFAAGMTLWAFVGVLLLPTPSRATVFAVDQAASSELGAAAVEDAIERLDRWQDDEERRSAGVETIFHPVPSRSARLDRLGRHQVGRSVPQIWHGHHLARHALWLGWGTLSPISRAVHCNVGRTPLWAMLPGD